MLTCKIRDMDMNFVLCVMVWMELKENNKTGGIEAIFHNFYSSIENINRRWGNMWGKCKEDERWWIISDKVGENSLSQCTSYPVIPHLTTQPHSVVPLTRQLVQLLRVEAEQDVEDVLVGQLDPVLVLVMHGHGGPNPPIRDVPHPVQVHVHDASIQSSLPIIWNLVSLWAIVVHAGSHGCYVAGWKIIKERPEIFRRSEQGQWLK